MDIENSNNNELDLSGIYRLFHLTIKEHIFISSAHRIVIKIDYILGH